MNGTALPSSARVGAAARALWILAPLAIFGAVLARFTELSALLAVFAGAAPRWLFAACLLTAVYTVGQGALYRGIFRVLGVEVPLVDAVALALVMAFASMALPAGTAAGIAYFVAASRGRGLLGSQALLAALGYYLFDYALLTPVLIAGALVLRAQQDAGPLPGGALGLFSLLVLTVGGVVVWGVLRPHGAAALVVAAAHRMGRLLPRRRAALTVSALRFGREVQDVCAAVRGQPYRSIGPLAQAVLLQVLGIALLGATFAALGYRLPPAALVAAYAAGSLFMIVSVTPSGAGVVESVMTLTLVSLGVPAEISAAGTILFRLFTFWLPMLAGFLTWRILRPVPA